ncbi:hypothetical protein CO229_01505 [Mycoplasmopsis bovirhinis]|uniref:MAG0490 family ComEA-like DNA-binding protein n=1 Tax=Mycoplasmopsis bovirhinis TaxID=29553 RepID=UPI000C05B6B7|nr:hypothetical protein [Mycoplasmopsis bovirhinis]ATO30792.1 hypothetical protein CO229_01505 [Mycoplasmopsis bovirhinis]
MKRKTFGQILLIFIFLFSVAGTIVVLQVYINKPKDEQYNNEEKIHVYYVSGAVVNDGVIKSTKKLTYRELLFQAKVQDLADLSNFKLNNFVPDSSKIHVPFSDTKLRWIDFENIKQISPLKLSNKISQALLDYRKENPKTTWKKIEQISGIGTKTLEKLMNFFELI